MSAMLRDLGLLAVGLVLLSATTLRGEDAVLSEMYGAGVHAYYSGEYVSAYEDLTAAIDGGTVDPRCYYFRGLTYMKLGRQDEAEMDFAEGADLESRDLDGFYNVARSLERVQGSTRLLLEGYRAEARMAAMKRAEEARRARYEAIAQGEARVLSNQIELEPERPRTILEEPGVFVESEEPFLGPAAAPAVAPEPWASPETRPPSQPTDDPFSFANPSETPAAGASGGGGSGGLFGSLRDAVGRALGGGDEEPGAAIEQPMPPGLDTTEEFGGFFEGAEPPPEGEATDLEPAEGWPGAELPDEDPFNELFDEPPAAPSIPDIPPVDDPFDDWGADEPPAAPSIPDIPPVDNPFDDGGAEEPEPDDFDDFFP